MKRNLTSFEGFVGILDGFTSFVVFIKYFHFPLINITSPESSNLNISRAWFWCTFTCFSFVDTTVFNLISEFLCLIKSDWCIEGEDNSWIFFEFDRCELDIEYWAEGFWFSVRILKNTMFSKQWKIIEMIYLYLSVCIYKYFCYSDDDAKFGSKHCCVLLPVLTLNFSDHFPSPTLLVARILTS